MEGRITRIISGFYDVLSFENQKEYKLLRGSGKLRKSNITPLVGDIVEFDPQGLVQIVKTRQNFLDRPKVANIDLAIIVTSVVEPNFSSLLVDKLLLLFEYKQITPIIIITKADLVESIPTDILNYQKMGYKIFILNHKEEINQQLIDILENKLCFVVGQSGVGKTSFINNLTNGNYKVQSISKALNRGKHTTRVTQVIRYKNFQIIDTPGFSSFEINLNKQQIAVAFEQFATLAKKCKFNTCLHMQENKEICVVKQEVEKKTILPFRYKNYLYFLRKQDEKNY